MNTLGIKTAEVQVVTMDDTHFVCPIIDCKIISKHPSDLKEHIIEHFVCPSQNDKEKKVCPICLDGVSDRSSIFSHCYSNSSSVHISTDAKYHQHYVVSSILYSETDENDKICKKAIEAEIRHKQCMDKQWKLAHIHLIKKFLSTLPSCSCSSHSDECSSVCSYTGREPLLRNTETCHAECDNA